MTVAALDSGGQFRIGSVVNGAWRVLSANFLFFFGVSLVVSLPQMFLQEPSQPQSIHWAVALAIIPWLALYVVVQAIVLFGAFQSLRGQPVAVGVSVQRALTRFLPLIGLVLLISLCIVLLGGVFMIVGVGIAAVLGPGGSVSVVMV
jgi:hypothetical protein